MNSFVPATGPTVEQAGITIHKILGGLGLPNIIVVIVATVIEIVSRLAAALSGAVFSTKALDSFHTQTSINVYITVIVGFFLIVNILGRIPLLLPLAIILGVLVSVVLGLAGLVTGVLADLLVPPFKS